MADVSVVIPCFNSERYIAATIESVLAQTTGVREVLVIDDGSTDASADVVARFEREHERVALIRQANAGESRARNVGIERAAGVFIAFLDSDDVWLPEKAEKQLAMFDAHPEAVCVHCRVFNFENEIDDRSREESEQTKDDPSVEELIEYHWVQPSASMVRRSALNEHGVRFEEDIQHSEDMLFFADVRRAGPIRLVDEPLLAKRVHAARQSSQRWHRLYSLESRATWLQRRRDVLEPALHDRLRDAIGDKMIALLEDRYWRRELDGFAEARRRVGEFFPQKLAASDVASRRIYPKWMYWIKDRLARSG